MTERHKTNNRFKRKGEGCLPLRKIFLLACEGKETEKNYFTVLHKLIGPCNFKFSYVTRDGKSAPGYLKKKLEKAIKDHDLGRGDEAWAVVDCDQWPEEHLLELSNCKPSNGVTYGFACSNPCFEYWLLLHFEEGKTKNDTAATCREALRKHLPHFDKSYDFKGRFSEEQVRAASARARQRDQNRSDQDKWPKISGSTTVYLLAERILEIKKI